MSSAVGVPEVLDAQVVDGRGHVGVEVLNQLSNLRHVRRGGHDEDGIAAGVEGDADLMLVGAFVAGRVRAGRRSWSAACRRGPPTPCAGGTASPGRRRRCPRRGPSRPFRRPSCATSGRPPAGRSAAAPGSARRTTAASSVIVPCCVCVVRLTVAFCVLPAGPTLTRWYSWRERVGDAGGVALAQAQHLDLELGRGGDCRAIFLIRLTMACTSAGLLPVTTIQAESGQRLDGHRRTRGRQGFPARSAPRPAAAAAAARGRAAAARRRRAERRRRSRPSGSRRLVADRRRETAEGRP